MGSLITEPLGLYGWRDREAVLLAALLTEEPLLLVGRHGCAKSFILERLAQSLGMEFRFYNASLVNYDDIVGIPLPNDTRTDINFLAPKNGIWDAQVVFFDEINRTRPDLQNKLFPIIHEKRIQGRPLERLVYRWAAMNPPPPEDADTSDEALYLGAEPLDAALADRFTFIMDVPDWLALSEADQLKVLSDQFAGRHEFPVEIGTLVAKAKDNFRRFTKVLEPQMAKFIVALVPQLIGAKFDVSTRRACMIERAILAVHASLTVIASTCGDEAPDLYGSAILALQYALPDRVRREISRVAVTALAKKAWEIAEMANDDPTRDLLLVPDPVVRLEHLAKGRLPIKSADAAVVIGEGIAAAKPPFRRGLAIATYLAMRKRTDIPASTMELLISEIRPAIQPSVNSVSVPMGKAQLTRAIGAAIAETNGKYGNDTPLAKYHANLLYSQLPDGYISAGEVMEVSREFTRLWEEFNL